MTQQEQCKVLIVDDEVLIRQGIKHYVNWQEEGFTIIGEASNGEEALAIIRENTPHIVITDIVMPIMDGIELTKVVKAEFPEIEVIILSSFSDFDYVRSTFQSGVADYILKPKLEGPELLKALKQAVRRLPNFQLNSFNLSITTIEEWIQYVMAGHGPVNQMELVHEVFSKEFFCLLGIDIQKGQEIHKIKRDIAEQLPNLLADYIYYPISIEEQHLTYILNIDKDTFPSLISIITKAAKTAERIDLSIVWFLGEPFKEIRQLKKQYEEELERLRSYQFYFPEETLIMQGKLPGITVEHNFSLNHFIDVFKRRNFEQAFADLEQYTQYISRQYTLNENEFKATLGNLLFNITILLEEMNFDLHSMKRDHYQYFAKINDTKHVDKAISCFQMFIAEVQDIISSQMSKNNQSNMILSYIEQHYNESINLADLAEHFHFNPSYLSTYFSQHHGTGFNEYLTQVRIEKAKAYLKDGQVSISEISGLVGYSDHSYFCKVFKKMTGLSPSKYRRSSQL